MSLKPRVPLCLLNPLRVKPPPQAQVKNKLTWQFYGLARTKLAILAKVSIGYVFNEFDS